VLTTSGMVIFLQLLLLKLIYGFIRSNFKFVSMCYQHPHSFYLHRSETINSFEWGKDTVLSVRFDPGDCNILITSGR